MKKIKYKGENNGNLIYIVCEDEDAINMMNMIYETYPHSNLSISITNDKIKLIDTERTVHIRNIYKNAIDVKTQELTIKNILQNIIQIENIHSIDNMSIIESCTHSYGHYHISTLIDFMKDLLEKYTLTKKE